MMVNLLEETISILKANGKTKEDVLWIGKIHAFRYGHDKEPAWFKNEEGALWSRDFDEPTAPILLEIYGKEIIVTKGDWIILDAKDKLYSCNHHIFITTYEPTK